MDGATNSYVGSVLKKRLPRSCHGEQRVKNHFNYQEVAEIYKCGILHVCHFEQVWHATLLMAKSVTLKIMFIKRCGSRDKCFLGCGIEE